MFTGQDSVSASCPVNQSLLVHNWLSLYEVALGIFYKFVAFCSFFPCSLTVFNRGSNKKVGVDNEKALELINSTVFHGVDNEKALELDNRKFFSDFSLISI